jgi:hypothetical protein
MLIVLAAVAKEILAPAASTMVPVEVAAPVPNAAT